MLAKNKNCFYLLLCFPMVISSNETNPVVQIHEGHLRGKSNTSRDGRDYYQFLGIRYAKLNRRFQVASAPEAWEGIQNATSFGPRCLVSHFENGIAIYAGEEDCLYANVYTPKIPERDGDEPSPLFPVMVFFHEGGFIYGSGHVYDPKYLMDEDIVLVIINYRLSAMVHAGGASVTYHLLSKMSRGLYHRAVAQSGSALNPWAFAPRPLENTKILAKEIGCLFNDTKSIISCLQNKDARDIVKLQKQPFIKWGGEPLYVFVPSVEKMIGDGKDNFLTETPREIINSGSFPNNVPFMTGSVTEDGLLLHGLYVANDSSLSHSMDINWDFVAPITFFYQDIQESNCSAAKEISKKVRHFYFNVSDSIGWDTKFKLSHVYSDRWFLKGINDLAVSYAQSTTNSVFNYLVTYNKQWGQLEQYYGKKFDVSHGDDLHLLFKKSNVTEITKESEHYNISKKYIKLWINFATFGDPNGYQVTGTNWTALNHHDQPVKWFHINEKFQMTASYLTERLNFWNSVPVSQ